MIKKGISLILFCLCCVLSYAQENFTDTSDSIPTESGSATLWYVLGCALISGTVMYFIGSYVNHKKQKTNQQQDLNQNAPKIDVIETQSVKTSIPNSGAIGGGVLDNTNIGNVLPNQEMQSDDDDSLIEDEEESVATVSDNAKPKILVIEDHKDIRLYLKILFSNEYNLVMAENGEEGLKMARKELPDLIITDVMMPMMNGFECCKRIKEDLKTCHIPIIVLTALIGDEDVVKGIELGADDYILKPFNPEILKTKVKRLIKSRQELKHIYTRLLMPAVNGGEEKSETEEQVQVQDPFISQIVQIVENNMQNPDFSVKRLSEMLNMSQPTLYRRVKLLTNFTIIELVRGVRLKRSAELLKSRQYNVQEVAELVGYNDIPTFRKHFVDFYGTTPSTFGRDEM